MTLPTFVFHAILQMVITTLEDLQRLYPGIIPNEKVSDIKDKSIDQVSTCST